MRSTIASIPDAEGCMRKPLIFLILLASAGGAWAQTSASYRLEEHVLNAGGNPADGTTLASTGYQMTLDSVGEAFAAGPATSASFSAESGFSRAYPPAGEVENLQLLSDAETLAWDAQGSAGSYHLYRDLLTALSDASHGICHEADIAGQTTSDTEVPPLDDAYFYLLSVVNRLGEEGTLGAGSDLLERDTFTACP
jgi:hypothetical protein